MRTSLHVLDLHQHILDAWAEGVKHGHDLVVANVRRTALHRREDATLCVCMTCGTTWREDCVTGRSDDDRRHDTAASACS
jgi:hypothetical protein